MARRVLLLTDSAMAAHAAPGHPERPERVAPVVDGVEDGARRAGAALERRAVRRADDEAVLRVHAAWYVEALDEAAARGGGWLDTDTYVVDGSMQAARLAAGATVEAALAVARREAELGYAVVRPPGHHASRERGSGFCLLNNVAIAVEALRAAGLAQRVAIVDWDVHHGDGTQAIFDSDFDLCYASSHQAPLYPGTGSPEERGSGRAVGTKHNRPLPPGSGDVEFVAVWRDELLPAIEAFAPEAILVSSGYDAHAADPLADLRVTEAGFEAVARLVGDAARRVDLPGVALTLEGGYDMGALRASAAATVVGLLGRGGDGTK